MESWQARGRSRSPEETVSCMRPFFSRLGITRLAKQTDLDDIGIPCYASFRPAARTLSTNQGKGVHDDDARASAVMEAVEFAVAEAPGIDARHASLADLEAGGTPIFWPLRLLRADFEPNPYAAMRWLSAHGLLTRQHCLIPEDAVVLSGDAADLHGVCQSTNGLASGNTRDEAIAHALCELIERDGTTKWLLLPQHQRHKTRFDPVSLADPVLDTLIEKVLASGKQIAVFDQTTDIGIPVVMALIADVRHGKRFDLAAGYGAHPDAAQAAIRAVTEAAQTRITSIAGARDDIAPGDFNKWLERDGLELALPAQPSRRGPSSIPHDSTASEVIGVIARALQAVGLAEPIVVDLDDGSLPCAVVRVISSDLEDLEANLNWRPGPRAQRWQGP